MFDDSDKVSADVVLLYVFPQSFLLDVHKEMVEVLLVLEMFLTKDSWVEDLFYGALSCSEVCLFFSVCLRTVQYWWISIGLVIILSIGLASLALL